MLGKTFKRTIVVSAIAVQGGGRMELLRQCLQHLSGLAEDGSTRVIAFVSDRSQFEFPHIEYREYPGAAVQQHERRRVEYKRLFWDSVMISEQDDKPVDLWLSLFDITPKVQAARQAVFCSNPFPWLQIRPRDWMMDRDVPRAVHAARKDYKKNLSRNSFLIVRQDFLRKQMARLGRFDEKKIIVFPSALTLSPPKKIDHINSNVYTFFCPSTPDCYKNFEVVCEAARLLELEIGRRRFRVECTIRGEDNKYGWWLKSNWDHVDSIHFGGFQTPSKLWGWYNAADCLVYASRVEAWGLPISEFAPTLKPMLLVDLPYAHETAAGALQVGFFPVHDAVALKDHMKALVMGDGSRLSAVPVRKPLEPTVTDWASLFDLLLSDN